MPQSAVSTGSKTKHNIAVVIRGKIELPHSIDRWLHRITKNYPVISRDTPLFHERRSKFGRRLLDSFDRFIRRAAARDQQGVRTRRADPVRRHLAIIDPSRLRRDCLKLALGLRAKRWRVTDVAAPAELARLIEQGLRFAVILFGGPTCRQISLADLDLLLAAAPGTPILVAADCDDRKRALALIDAGASGFLPTNLGLKVLLAALERVRTGATYVPLILTKPAPAGGAPEGSAVPRCELTRRQCEVLALISEGLSNRLIAAALALTESTVKAHVTQIIRRLNVANRTQAALFAARGDHRAAVAPGEEVVGRVS
jgi:DNA-binding NarL/FixJ family response regulator